MGLYPPSDPEEYRRYLVRSARRRERLGTIAGSLVLLGVVVLLGYYLVSGAVEGWRNPDPYPDYDSGEYGCIGGRFEYECADD